MNETHAITRLVDKAHSPAKDFLKAIATVLSVGDYQLSAYGVDSENQWAERESASVKLDERTTLTIALSRSK